MEVAAHPDHGCRIERGVPRPVLPKEMAIAAEESEGTLSHRLVLHVEALGITPLVEAQDAGCHHSDVSCTSEGHHRCLAMWRQIARSSTAARRSQPPSDGTCNRYKATLQRASSISRENLHLNLLASALTLRELSPRCRRDPAGAARSGLHAVRSEPPAHLARRRRGERALVRELCRADARAGARERPPHCSPRGRLLEHRHDARACPPFA